MKVIIFLFAFTNALLSWASAIDADKLPLVRLGVSSLAEPSTNIPLVSRTIEQLQKDFGQRNIRVIRYPLEDLDRAIENDWNWDVGAEFRISIKKLELQGLRP